MLTRGMPISNKILQKKWVEYEQDLHKKKLSEIKPRVDSSCPPDYRHLKDRKKKEQQLEDRFTEIEKHNRLLLERVSSIMKKNTLSDMSFPSTSFPTSTTKKKSLNFESRKKKLVEITNENHAMLRRLQDKRSEYDADRFRLQRKKIEHILKNISEFPYVYRPRKHYRDMSEIESTADELTDRRTTPILNTTFDGEIDTHRTNKTTTPFDKFKYRNGISAGGVRLNPKISILFENQPSTSFQTVPNNDERPTKPSPITKALMKNDESHIGVNECKIVVYKKGEEISGIPCIVEISKSVVNPLQMFICAFSIDNSNNHYITLNAQQSEKLLEESDNSYEKIVKRLRFKNNELKINNFRLNFGKSKSPQPIRDRTELTPLTCNRPNGFGILPHPPLTANPTYKPRNHILNKVVFNSNKTGDNFKIPKVSLQKKPNTANYSYTNGYNYRTTNPNSVFNTSLTNHYKNTSNKIETLPNPKATLKMEDTSESGSDEPKGKVLANLKNRVSSGKRPNASKVTRTLEKEAKASLTSININVNLKHKNYIAKIKNLMKENRRTSEDPSNSGFHPIIPPEEKSMKKRRLKNAHLMKLNNLAGKYYKTDANFNTLVPKKHSRKPEFIRSITPTVDPKFGEVRKSNDLIRGMRMKSTIE